MSEQQTIREVEPPAPGDVARDRAGRPRRLPPVLQPRAVVAGLQRPRARARRADRHAAAGAREVRRDLHLEPRRVLHDPRRRPARPGRRRASSDPGADGRTPSQVDRRAPRADPRARPSAVCRCVETELRPALAEHGVRIVRWHEVVRRRAQALDERFRRQIFPVLTPLAVGLGRPFPYISNLSLSLAVLVRDPQTQVTTFARVKVPKEMLPRFVGVGRRARRSCALEELIAAATSTRSSRAWRSSSTASSASRATPTSRSPTRPTTCSRAVEAELRRRRFGEVVRVEVDAGMSDAAARAARPTALEVEERQVYDVDGLLDLTDLWQIVQAAGLQRAARRAVDARSRSRGCRATTARASTCSRRCARATCSSTTPTTRSRPRSSASSSRPPTTPTSWRSR